MMESIEHQLNLRIQIDFCDRLQLNYSISSKSWSSIMGNIGSIFLSSS